MKKINIVLFEPEIPQNTGNIMRSCVAFNATLHLIKPYGFKIDDKHVKRSAVNYFENLEYYEYDNLDDFIMKNKGKYFLLTRYGKKTPYNIEFEKIDENIYLIFGKESTGLPYDFIKKNFSDSFRIPTTNLVRSINLSNCVAIMLAFAQSKLKESVLYTCEPDNLKGEDFIINRGD